MKQFIFSEIRSSVIIRKENTIFIACVHYLYINSTHGNYRVKIIEITKKSIFKVIILHTEAP